MNSMTSSLSRRQASWPMRMLMALLAVLCTALTSTAWADPPGRVGRLGEMTGQVWFFSPDSGEWVSAARNRPLTSGDRVATDAGARAEVRIGSSTVRLDAGSELEVLRIDDDQVSLQLHNGSMATHIRSSDSAREFELRTGEGRFLTRRPGRYRFDRADEASHVTVLSGEALYEGPGSALTVYAGQRAEFWLDNNAAQYSITDPVRDDFAAWSADQDRRDDRSVSTRYVSPEMTGAEDLDRYGRWEQAPDYGAVWVPRAVPVGWAPYSVGHWAWVSPWGWTWIDDQPWGFAPFHYGRWVNYRERWCWVPGTYVRRPVYAPAVVGWVGGPHFSLSISVGNTEPAVGWFPLAPREVYVPSYRVSPTYIKQVNVTHVTNITNITTIVNNPQQAVVNVDYRNRHIPHAVTVVPQTVFVNRQPVAPAAAQWRNTPVMQQALAAAQQKVTVAAPPVPAPAVDEVRRRHGFGPEGPRQPVASPQGAPSANIAPAGGVNIPPPQGHAVSPAVRPGEGDARARFEQRRRDVHEDGRAQPAPATATPVSPGQTTAQPAHAPATLPANAANPVRPVVTAPAAQPVAPPPATRTLPPMEAARQEAVRQQEAQRQQQEAQRLEQQRQQEVRRQHDLQRQQEAAQRQQEQRGRFNVPPPPNAAQAPREAARPPVPEQQRPAPAPAAAKPAPEPQAPKPEAARAPTPEQQAAKEEKKREEERRGHQRGEGRQAN